MCSSFDQWKTGTYPHATNFLNSLSFSSGVGKGYHIL